MSIAQDSQAGVRGGLPRPLGNDHRGPPAFFASTRWCADLTMWRERRN